jgi:hypothetical protein
MPITAASMANTCYRDISRTPNALGVNGAHTKYDSTDRVTHAITPAVGNFANLTFAGAPAGNTYYLPWQQNGITSSTVLVTPGLGDVDYFITSELNGCAVFVDTYVPTAAEGYVDPITGAADIRPRLIIYHANAITQYNAGNVGLTPVQIQGNATLFPGVAATQVTNYRNAARTNYQGVKVGLKSLMKPQYYAQVDVAMNRKRQQGRTNVTYGGRAFVVGFYLPGGWQFYYQAYCALSYTRPGNAPKGWILGRQHTAGLTDYRVVDSAQF